MFKKWLKQKRTQSSYSEQASSSHQNPQASSAETISDDDLGTRAIEQVFTQYKIDDEWSVREARVLDAAQ